MSGARVRLGVNIDHVATIRNARGGRHPDPVRAARLAAEAGADGITAHLREDRRHISDADIRRLRDGIDLPLNLEMAATPEMLAVARAARPSRVCLVPEKRAELTTEGGLDLAAAGDAVREAARVLEGEGIPLTYFLDPDPDALARAAEIGGHAVELHTGAFAGADAARRGPRLDALRAAAVAAAAHGFEVHAGHGLDYRSAGPVAALPEVVELNIGHFLIGEAVFVGLRESVRAMRAAIDRAVSGTAP